MEKILTEGREAAAGFCELILQPQSDVPHFRHFIRDAGYEIVRENMILEDGKFYPMMKAVPAERAAMPVWTPEEEAFGKLLLEQRHPVLKQYLERELRLREEILKKLSAEASPAVRERTKEVEEERQQILAALHVYESE
jgi:tRNA (adenine22-N1)-methyltransferase